MTPRFHLALLILLSSSHLISSIRRASDNDSPLAAYLVAVRRPDGLAGVDEPDALEQWHTHLLEQVCNTSDPATAQRFPTAESRLIYSYSHVASGFSAWLTPQEVEAMATLPWFVEAIPDKSYKLMSVDDTPTSQLSWLDDIRDGVWSKGNMGEGMVIGILDAGIAAGDVPASSEPEGMPSPPVKWKGRCDNNEACNNRLIGFKTFVGTSHGLVSDDKFMHVARPASGGAHGHSPPRASVLGIPYDEAFAVAPKAHLAVYHVCDEECHAKDVIAGMDAAVEDDVDVIWVSFNSTDDNTAFHDDAVTAPSYSTVAQGVLVCAPAGSSSPDMLKVESNAPWLLTVAASDTDRRVVTNVELGSGILKPDVSTPSANTLAVGDVVQYTNTQIKVATSMAAAHVSGVAAMIKKAHPDWSPAAIKSAMVTTADPVGPGDAVAGDDGASHFVTGAGEVNPTKAMDPGLVYDLSAGDFIPYLCGMSLGEHRIRKIVGTAHASCTETGEIAAKDLNYPSVLIFTGDDVRQVEAKRTVTNVGDPAETYNAEVFVPGVDVVVNPSTLVFSNIGQKRDFVVTVRRQANTPKEALIEGELKWVSEKHAVRSPLVVVVGETSASSAGHSHGADVASIDS